MEDFTLTHGQWTNWRLDVDGDELIARGGKSSETVLRGQQLVGAVLWLSIDDEPTIPVLIAAYEEVPSWASNGKAVAAYAMVYANVGESNSNRGVCKGTAIDPYEPAVVVLAGELYDEATKTVIPNQEGWITLACAGSASAKMALLGYGPHAKFIDDSQPASVTQRQATLKMITADYCGDGYSYTVSGVPLAWENQLGTVLPVNPPGVLEAVWNKHGAVCLDQPRRVDRRQVACSLPSCDDLTLDDGDWVTYNVQVND